MSINKLILEQLNKSHVNYGEYDAIHHSFTIKKQEKIELQTSTIYVAKLDDSLLNANSNSTLVSNWNAGKFPTKPYLRFVISKKLGQMVYVLGVYYDINTKTDLDEEFEGWLPVAQLEIKEESKL